MYFFYKYVTENFAVVAVVVSLVPHSDCGRLLQEEDNLQAAARRQARVRPWLVRKY